MNASSALSAEAFFGSAARRDGDMLSDLDYLIVGDDTPSLRARKIWLQARGFSVSDYTWSRLEKQSFARTLFMMHLKLEARITVDCSSRLTSLLAGTEPKASYLSDYRDSLALFDPLKAVPEHPRGFAWAADTLAVAFRNSAILLLATQGEFSFSMEKLIQSLRFRGLITSQQLEDLRALRIWKSAYRTSCDFGLEARAFYKAAGAARAALDHDFDFSSTRELVVADSSSISSGSTGGYAYMRALESELISLPASLLRNTRVRRVRDMLLQYLADPHSYLWSFMRSTPHITGPLSELRSYY